jgi:hypothetical protein
MCGKKARLLQIASLAVPVLTDYHVRVLCVSTRSSSVFVCYNVRTLSVLTANVKYTATLKATEFLDEPRIQLSCG